MDVGNPVRVGNTIGATYKVASVGATRECLSDRPQTSWAHGASDARALRSELAAAMATVLAFEPLAYLDCGCAPACVPRDFI
jgi:hypothetical protein